MRPLLTIVCDCEIRSVLDVSIINKRNTPALPMLASASASLPRTAYRDQGRNVPHPVSGGVTPGDLQLGVHDHVFFIFLVRGNEAVKLLSPDLLARYILGCVSSNCLWIGPSYIAGNTAVTPRWVANFKTKDKC